MAVKGERISDLAISNNPTVYMSGTTARIAYKMGINAKNRMCEDEYLAHFLPKISNKLLKKHSVDSYGDLDRHINEDTRLLATLAEESVDEMRDEWEEEIEMAESIKSKAKHAIDILEYNMKKGDMDISEKKVSDTMNRIRTVSKEYQQIREDIKNKKDKCNAETDYSQKIAFYTAIRNDYSRLNYIASALSKNKANLVVNNHFDFLVHDTSMATALGVDCIPGKKTKKAGRAIEDIDTTIYLSTFIERERGIIDRLKNGYTDKNGKRHPGYLEKYGCVPKFLKAYETIIVNMEIELTQDQPDIERWRQLIEKDITQYIDVLKDGPNVIQQISRIYPNLQQTYEREILLERAGNNLLNAKMPVEMEYKAVNNMPFLFKTIMGNEYTTARKNNEKFDMEILSIVGPPGIGKTASCEAICRELGLLFKSISLPHADESVFSGLVTVTEKDEVRQLTSSDMKDAINDYGIIDLEEATAASEAVLNKMAQFLQKGAIGLNKSLHPLSIVVMTSNDNLEDNPNINQFSNVLLTRMETIEWKNPRVTLNGWCNYVLNEPYIQNDPILASAFNMVITFLRMDEEGRKYDGVSDESRAVRKTQEGKTSANFRTWTKFAFDVATILDNTSLSPESKVNMLISNGIGVIGEPAVKAFAKSYMLMSKLPSIDTLLKKIENADPAWKIIDAVRVMDMTDSELIDNSRKSRMETSKNSGDKEGAAPKKGRGKAEGRFTIKANADDDKALLERFKDMQKILYGANPNISKITTEDLMSDSDLTNNYNDLWGKSNVDLTNAAVDFTLSSRISSELTRLYEDAYREKRPVDGNKADNLFKLAMTIPSREYRQSLVGSLMKQTYYADYREVLYKYGVKSVNHKTGKTCIWRYVPDILKMRGDPSPKKLNFDEEKAKILAEPREDGVAIEVTSIPRLFQIQHQIHNLSTSYGKMLTKEKELMFGEKKEADTGVER